MRTVFSPLDDLFYLYFFWSEPRSDFWFWSSFKTHFFLIQSESEWIQSQFESAVWWRISAISSAVELHSSVLTWVEAEKRQEVVVDSALCSCRICFAGSSDSCESAGWAAESCSEGEQLEPLPPCGPPSCQPNTETNGFITGNLMPSE